MMVAARAMKFGMEILEPLIVGRSISTKGKILIGTIKGDLHDIGKNLVGMMFRGAGFEVVDIGVDVPKQAFLEGIQRESPHIVAICALLTTVLHELSEAVSYLPEAGGQPVSGSWWEVLRLTRIMPRELVRTVTRMTRAKPSKWQRNYWAIQSDQRYTANWRCESVL